jgi:septal ring factor EnvC (AmiA/AmiB activator)
MDDARFDRLEQKIDKLTDAVTAIARVEEKILASNMRLDRAEQRLDNNEMELDELAKMVRDNQGVVKFADKFFWLAIGGLVSLTVWVFKTGLTG